MLVTSLLFAFFACIFAEQSTIYHEGIFSSMLYDSALSQKEGVTTLSYAYPLSTCVSLISVEATEKATAVLQTITRPDGNGAFIWGEVARTEIIKGQGAMILSPPQCSARFRILLSHGHFTTVSTESEQISLNDKRDVTCVGSGGSWPASCGTAPEGQYCLTSQKCGCLVDYDCYGNAVLPFCDTTQSVCASCFKSPTTGTSPSGVAYTAFSKHYFCRSRFPSPYITDSSLHAASPPAGPDFSKLQSIVGERTPDLLDPSGLGGYFREICSNLSPDPAVVATQQTNTLGSCERCQQAANLADIWLPNYNFPATNSNPFPNEGPKSTYFCRFIRGYVVPGINSALITSQQPTPYRPICATLEYFTAVGMASLYTSVSVTEEVNSWGVENGGPTPNQKNVLRTYNVSEWEGACVPCALTNGGVLTAYHGLCSLALDFHNITATQNSVVFTESSPICNITTGGCDRCNSNADCGLGQEGVPMFNTGGPNCMVNGYCIRCYSNADCGTLDLGNDPICDVPSGICKALTPCDANFGEVGTFVNQCTQSAPNCYTDGVCRSCLTYSSGCTGDGPSSRPTAGQTVCDSTSGICRGCTTNADCAAAFPNTNRYNCYTDGTCKDCTLASCTNDGGGTGVACSSLFCVDQNGQTLCNPVSHACENPCTSNPFCANRGVVLGTSAGGGANCQASGFCLDCGTQQLNSPNCGALDGGETPGQIDCGPSNLCYNPAVCAQNSNCTSATGVTSNCQVTGGCIPCSVTYLQSTCGAGKDGGTPSGQPNCQLSTSWCVNPCNTESDCVGTQGANCMANGVCFDCRTNADCQTSAPWGGDHLGRTLCMNTLCTYACDANYNEGGNHPCGSSTPNCQADGTCVKCGSNTDCTNDGPPPAGSNTLCDTNSGKCVNPYLCTTGGANGGNADNVGCQQHYNDGQHQNCNQDGSCSNCASNAFCQANDGGLIPKQPRCGSDGVCTSCASNADCPATAANCMWDGSCQDCRTRTAGAQCGGPLIDGPPGTNPPNPNCDPLTGICVDFCVQDSDCTSTACTPVCQIERGCCVECNTNANCPVPQWRGTEAASKTMCDTRNGYMCVYPVACTLDTDCPASAPACSYSENKCVQCKADSHCSRNTNTTIACDVGREKCVQCVSNVHCPGPNTVCDPRTNFCVLASGWSLTASVFLSLALLSITFF